MKKTSVLAKNPAFYVGPNIPNQIDLFFDESVYFMKTRDIIEDKLIILKDHKKLWNIRIK